MIKLEFFAYTDEQRNDIRTVVRDALDKDVDRIVRQITPVVGQYSIIGMEPLWCRIEIAATLYQMHSAVSRQRRAELVALRKSAEKLRASIIIAVAVKVGTKGDPLVHPLLLNGVDADMLTATSHYFRKLKRNLDRQIELAGSRRDSARKTARNEFWNSLLAIWCDLGGKPPHRKAAARFLIAASKPVMSIADTDIPMVVKWLERQCKTGSKVVKPVQRRRATR
jgi:hypothetical protein